MPHLSVKVEIVLHLLEHLTIPILILVLLPEQLLLLWVMLLVIPLSDTLTVSIAKSDNQAPTITGFASASVTHFANLYSTPNSNKTHTETFTVCC